MHLPTPSSHSALRSVSTPKRYSDVHARTGTTSRTPSHSLSTASSRAKTSLRRGRELEIGDEVRMEGSELVGVLRHLGPVEFRPGFYAGLELIGDSVGMGKNDGSVQGVQYFACTPGNGVFCPASKVVALNDKPPSDAVARPASALSNRSSSRASDVSDRHAAITPARRRISSVQSTTPSRSSSRASVRPPSVTPGMRSVSSLGTSRPASRLASGLDASQSEMQTETHTSGLATPSGPRIAAPRQSIVGSQTPSATPVLAKKRQSLGGLPTPRATKGRASMFAKPSATSDSSMPPPPSPTKGMRTDRSVSALSFRSNSRLGQAESQSSPNGVSQDSKIDRNLLLLEQMDLTPKRITSSAIRPQSRAESRAGAHAFADGDLTRDSIAEAVVPLSLYEDQVIELDRLQAHLEQLEKQNQELQRAQAARKARMSEARSVEAVLEEERAKMRAEARERQSEMEEERRLEREDEVRRRKEIEDREREAKEKLLEAQNQLNKTKDEQDKLKGDFESQKRHLQTKLDTSETLVVEMKKRIEEESADKQRGQANEALETQLKLKDTEISSLKDSHRRLEAESQQERDNLSQQIDELKGAGRETISLYEQRIDEIEREKLEVLDNMELLEAKAQEAIRHAEARYEELQSAQRSTGVAGTLGGGSAAQIDNESLREQLAHLQDKLGKYEDQIAEAALVLEKEKENSQKRREKSQEVEASLKNELKRLKASMDRMQKGENELKQVAEETRRALRESQAALERERAELEGLRADMDHIDSLDGGTARSVATQAKKQWQTDKAAMEAEIVELTARIKTLSGSENLSLGDKVRAQLEKQLEAKDEELRHIRGRLEQARQASRGTSMDASMASQLENRDTRSFASAVDDHTGGRPSSGETSATSSANQMSGLSYLVRQLTEENNDAKAKYKLMESTLRSQLQDAVTKARTLEITVDSLKERTESTTGEADPQETIAAKLAEYEVRLGQSEDTVSTLKHRLETVEQEKRKAIGTHQKEVSELESLIESRIFREEELVSEIEKLKRKVDRGTNGTSPSAKRGSGMQPPASGPFATSISSTQMADKISLPSATQQAVNGITEPCDDCGELGHKFEDCPYAAEMF